MLKKAQAPGSSASLSAGKTSFLVYTNKKRTQPATGERRRVSVGQECSTCSSEPRLTGRPAPGRTGRDLQGHQPLRAAQAKSGRHKRELRAFPPSNSPSLLPLGSEGKCETLSQADIPMQTWRLARGQNLSFPLSPLWDVTSRSCAMKNVTLEG